MLPDDFAFSLNGASTTFQSELPRFTEKITFEQKASSFFNIKLKRLLGK